MEKVYRLGAVEDALAEMELFDVPDDILESEEDYQIVMSGWWVHIPELGLNLHEGIFCNYDEEEKEYLPDFALTAICNADTVSEREWIYWEQDDFTFTVANYLYAKSRQEARNIDSIENLFCTIQLPEESDEIKRLRE